MSIYGSRETYKFPFVSNSIVSGVSLDNQIVRSRKRMRNPQNHGEYKRKKLVQQGEMHVTKSGRIIQKKRFKAQRNCSCKRKCSRNIQIEAQKQIFKQFYQLENWCKKTLFLRSLVISSTNKKDWLNPIIKKKTFTHAYYLRNLNGETHIVCLKFLLTCLQISKTRIHRAINSQISNPKAVDRRGKFTNRITDPGDLAFLMEFIDKFPCYQSHYTSSNSSVNYLHPSLNIAVMYREYCSECEAKGRANTLKIWQFRYIFNTKFNLRFHRLKVDTCKTCDRLQSSLRISSGRKHAQLLKEKNIHHAVVQKYRTAFTETIANAKEIDQKVEIRTFDLQRALELPRLSTNIAFYKRQFCLYNLCVFDEVRQKGFMHVWPESIASRGAQEISSCLYRHLMETIPPDTKRLILYSDSCPGQNRNIKMSLMLSKFLASWPHPDLISIEQRFFVVGHSFNGCDRCFGLIEKEKKVTENIFLPEHWIDVMRNAKKRDPKFSVIEMRKKDFMSTKPLESTIVNRKVSINNQKISWNNFQSIMYYRDDPSFKN